MRIGAPFVPVHGPSGPVRRAVPFSTMEEVRRRDAERRADSAARAIVRFSLWIALGVALALGWRRLTGNRESPFSFSSLPVGWMVLLPVALLDSAAAYRRRIRGGEFRAPQYRDLWRAVEDRVLRVQTGMKDVPRALRKEADRLRIDAEVISHDLRLSLRSADLAAAELSTLPAPYVPPGSDSPDPRTAELRRIAESGLAELSRARDELVVRVRRAEARSAAFTATLDLWCLRVLHAKGSGAANRLHEVGAATAEARRSLAAIGAETPLDPSAADPSPVATSVRPPSAPPAFRPPEPARSEPTDLEVVDG